ncbi:hypothetical protein DFH09DRAFT_1336882 [Mycena vulgaris]|nr:hypothetical protein DFH09DRAFT_1336882 [Mycena vulgaris]
MSSQVAPPSPPPSAAIWLETLRPPPGSIPYPLDTDKVQTASRRAIHLWQGRDAASVGHQPAQISSVVSSYTRTVVGSGTRVPVEEDHQCANRPSSPQGFSLCANCEEHSYSMSDPSRIFFKFPRPDQRALVSPFYGIYVNKASCARTVVVFLAITLAARAGLYLPVYNLHADMYFDLGLAALALEPVFGSRDLQFRLPREAHVGFDNKTAQRRRVRTVLGGLLSRCIRPLTIPIADITSEFPADTEQTLNSKGRTIPGFYHTKWRFTKDITVPMAEVYTSGTSPTYKVYNFDWTSTNGDTDVYIYSGEFGTIHCCSALRGVDLGEYTVLMSSVARDSVRV